MINYAAEANQSVALDYGVRAPVVNGVISGVEHGIGISSLF
jgi:hypothetical protein